MLPVCTNSIISYSVILTLRFAYSNFLSALTAADIVCCRFKIVFTPSYTPLPIPLTSYPGPDPVPDPGSMSRQVSHASSHAASHPSATESVYMPSRLLGQSWGVGNRMLKFYASGDGHRLLHFKSV